jgi:hypothetical protein
MGEYEVCGKHEYRGHTPGTRFERRLDKGAEVRAINRGDIKLLRVITPSIQQGTWTLPAGWENTNEGKE